MLGITSSRAALAMSATALFVALGGTALAVSQIGTKQIKNEAVTTSKLHDKAVTNAKLGPNSVGSGKVKDGSLTSADVAPNTFLAAGGTAADSARLGGLLPADFVQGIGFMQKRRIVVAKGLGGVIFLNTLFGQFTANCSNTTVPTVTWTPTVSNAEFAASTFQGVSTVRLDTSSGIPAGTPRSEPVAPGGPFSITFQIAYTSGGQDHVVTAWITGRTEGATCVFTGQELSTG
jgi:hypothetical protein